MSSGTIEIEKGSLDVHVELCAHRYGQLESRLTNIEGKVETLQTTIEKSHMSMSRVLIGTAGTVVAGVISVIILIIVQLHGPHF